MHPNKELLLVFVNLLGRVDRRGEFHHVQPVRRHHQIGGHKICFTLDQHPDRAGPRAIRQSHTPRTFVREPEPEDHPRRGACCVDSPRDASNPLVQEDVPRRRAENCWRTVCPADTTSDVDEAGTDGNETRSRSDRPLIKRNTFEGKRRGNWKNCGSVWIKEKPRTTPNATRREQEWTVTIRNPIPLAKTAQAPRRRTLGDRSYGCWSRSERFAQEEDPATRK